MFRMVETEEKPETVQKFVQNMELYIKWLRKEDKNEVLAHWTTIFDSNAYPLTKVAILTHSPYIFSNIVEFIKNIQMT
jgi:hypothetical protein